MRRMTQNRQLVEAREIIQEMQGGGVYLAEDLSVAARAALKEIIEARMASAIDRRLSELETRGAEDRRNGTYPRHFLTSLGDLELMVPRTRSFSAKAVLGAYARRAREVDRVILACFVFGLSTRKVGQALLELLGERVSPATVSRVAKTLDAAVAAYHARPLQNRYRALMFDGVVLARKTGAGAVRRPVLVALGILPNGKKEVLDWRLEPSESAAAWERFLTSLYRRGLTGEGVELIAVDGGSGLLAALPTVYPHLPVQRCWAHKVRNVLDKLRKADRPKAKRGLRAIYQAATKPSAQKAAHRFAARWETRYPKAVACLRNDLDELLTFLGFKDKAWRKRVRTTNAIERRFREVKRRTRPMGVFSDRTSMERILYAIFIYENKKQNTAPLFLVTQSS